MAYTQRSKTMCHIFTVALSPLLGTFSCALGYDMAVSMLGQVWNAAKPLAGEV